MALQCNPAAAPVLQHEPAAAADKEDAADEEEDGAKEAGAAAGGLAESETNKEELDRKIECFKIVCETEEDFEKRGCFMKLFFKASERKALWGRLKTMRANAKPEVQEAWQEIDRKGSRTDKQREKEMYLATALTMPPQKWQEVVVKRTDMLRRLGETGVESKEMYEGELIQKQGWKEAMDLIAKGRYVACKDEDGDTYYKKVRKVEKDTLTWDKAIAAEGKPGASQKEFQQVALAMSKEFGTMDDTPCRKRLASSASLEDPTETKKCKEDEFSRQCAGSSGSAFMFADRKEEDEAEENEEEDDPEQEPEEEQYEVGEELKEFRKTKAKCGKMVKVLNELETKAMAQQSALKDVSRAKLSRDELGEHMTELKKLVECICYKISHDEGWTLAELKKDVIDGAELIKEMNATMFVAKGQMKAVKAAPFSKA